MSSFSIAIIGIGCRFPQVRNPHEFWELLRLGKEAIALAPESDNFRQRTMSRPLENVDRFDADFFGITPEVSALMDPQQRLLLEVAWETLEDAEIIPQALAGSQTGVFVGINNSYYGDLLDAAQKQKFETTTGNQAYIAANRLSYFFDFQGVSMSLNTACSSSLIAVERACQSLRLEESELAIAGGVNLVFENDGTTRLKQGGLISPDGRCKVFDATADGYGRSEGIGLVLLKPLAKAQADGDRIYAVIEGSAINHNGRNNGLTAPNFQAQIKLLEKACQQAQINPQAITYIEAHATGTPIGDALELKSIDRAIGKGRSPENPCYVGSVKTNIGHTETAAGIAGLIKVALSLYHREIPPHLHFTTPNPSIKFDKLHLQIPQTPIVFGDEQLPLYMGVSSFGLGGSNAHMLLTTTPPQLNQKSPESLPVNLFLLSAKTEKALKRLASQYLALCEQQPDLSLTDLCANVCTTRTQFSHRLTVVAESLPQLQTELKKFLENQPGDRLAVKHFNRRPQKQKLLTIIQDYADLETIEDSYKCVSSMDFELLTEFWRVLAKKWRDGTNFDWDFLYLPKKHQRFSLPKYPFEQQKFWSLPNLPPSDQLANTINSFGESSKSDACLPQPSLAVSEDYIPPQTPLEKQIVSIWEKALGKQRIGVKDNFFELGGSSQLAVQVFTETEKLFEQELPLSLLFQTPTIQGLISLLKSRKDQERKSSLVALQTQGNKPPLFCIHAIGTSTQFYRNLCPFLSPDQPLYGLQSLFLEQSKSDPNLTLEKMAALYINEIKKIQSSGPYSLCGYSYGGLIAYEMAQQLKANGEEVKLLAILDSVAPGGLYRLTKKEQFFEHLKNIKRQGLRYVFQKLARQLDFRITQLRKKLKTTFFKVKRDLSKPEYFETRLMQVQAIHRQIMRKYRLKNYSGDVVLFIAETKVDNVSERWQDDLGWQKYVQGYLKIYPITGCHFSIFQEPHVQFLAEKIQSHLEPVS